MSVSQSSFFSEDSPSSIKLGEETKRDIVPSGWESKQSDSGGPSQWPYCGRSFNDEAPEGPQTAYPTPQHEMRPFWIPQEHFSSVGSDLPPITAETTACKPLGGWHPACEDGSANGNDPNHGRPIAKAPSTQWRKEQQAWQQWSYGEMRPCLAVSSGRVPSASTSALSTVSITSEKPYTAQLEESTQPLLLFQRKHRDLVIEHQAIEQSITINVLMAQLYEERVKVARLQDELDKVRAGVGVSSDRVIFSTQDLAQGW